VSSPSYSGVPTNPIESLGETPLGAHVAHRRPDPRQAARLCLPGDALPAARPADDRHYLNRSDGSFRLNLPSGKSILSTNDFNDRQVILHAVVLEPRDMHNWTSFKITAFSVAALGIAALARPCGSADVAPAPDLSVPPLPKLAKLRVSGNGYRIKVLRNGVRSHSNRKYVWQRVPARLQGLSFTQLQGDKAAQIAIEVQESGTAFLALRRSRIRLCRSLESDGWKQTGMCFNYSHSGKSMLNVLSKHLPAGTKMTIPQVDTWTGPILIFPNPPAVNQVAGHQVRLRDGRVLVGVYDENTGIITLWGTHAGEDAQVKVRVEKEDITSITPRILQISHLTDAEKAARRKAADAAEKRREAERKRKLKEQAESALARVNAKLAQCQPTHEARLRELNAREKKLRNDIAALSAKIKAEKATHTRYKRFLRDWDPITGTKHSEWARLSRMRRALEADQQEHPKLVKKLKRLQMRIRKARAEHAKEVRLLTNAKKSLEQRVKQLDEANLGITSSSRGKPKPQVASPTRDQWEGKLVKGDASNRVYFVRKGVRHWLRRWRYARPFRLSASNMVEVKQHEIDALPDGPAINSIAEMKRWLKR